MEVILKEDIPSVGTTGDIVKVKPGFARNYLLPRGMAVLADPRNRDEREQPQSHFRVPIGHATLWSSVPQTRRRDPWSSAPGTRPSRG